MPDNTVQSKCYHKQGGDEIVVKSGGKVTVESGGSIEMAAGSTLKLDGAAIRMVAGEVTLDGSNPTSVTTGLTTITSAVAVFKQATAPGDDPVDLTVDYGGSVPAGRLDIHAWKNTGGTDPTLVASINNSAVVSYIAFGT